MTAELALYTLLSEDAAVSALAGNRIYPLRAPDRVALPYLTYQRISGARWRSIDGPSGMAQPRIQVDVWADRYDVSKSVAGAVRNALDGWRGTVAGVRVGGIALEGDQDLFEDEVDPPLYRVSLDFIVTHNE